MYVNLALVMFTTLLKHNTNVCSHKLEAITRADVNPEYFHQSVV